MSTVSLVRTSHDGRAFPALGRVSHMLASSLAKYFGGMSDSSVTVDAGVSEVSSYADWLERNGQHVLFPARLGRRLTAQFSISMPAFLGMVDVHYGGSGAPGAWRDALTLSEQRFADRIGAALANLVENAWSIIEPIQVEAEGVVLATHSTTFCRSSDPVVIQPFSLSGAPFAAGDIQLLFPLALLRSAVGSDGTERAGIPQKADADWSAKLNAAALNIRLPVRTIFARPEISFARLLSLRPGDIIPLLLPQHVPVTVAGRQFALGNIGEANGRAAIKIEKMQEGFFS